MFIFLLYLHRHIIIYQFNPTHYEKKHFFSICNRSYDFVIKDFANQVNKSIMDANVSPKLKKDLMTISDVTINSKLYWKHE